MIKKRSLIERLTGAVRVEEEEEDFDSEETLEKEGKPKIEEDDSEGQLSVDVFQNQNEIVIKTMVAGVRSEDLDVSITRDMVTIRGKREGERNVSADDYFHKELYWGSFSRTILLPQEVDIEAAEAVEKHGMLIIRLPKLDKDRQARLKVKNG